MSKGFAPTLTQPTNRPKTFEASALSQRVKDCFASIKDPRVERTRLHQHRTEIRQVWAIPLDQLPPSIKPRNG